MPTPFSADFITNTASLRPDGIFAEHRAGLGNAAGMIVSEYARRGILSQSFLHPFPRMDACAVDRAAEEILALDHAMPAVEVDHAKDFVRQRREVQDEIVPRCSRRRKRRAPAHSVRHADAGGCDGFIGRRLAHGTEAMIMDEKRIERAHERAPS